MKKDTTTLLHAQIAAFTFALRALKADFRMAESDFAFELAMLEFDRLIEMAEFMEWP